MYILVLFLLTPVVFYLFLIRGKIDWRIFGAIAVLFSCYPTYALTGKIYLVPLPVILFFILMRKKWKVQDQGSGYPGGSMG